MGEGAVDINSCPNRYSRWGVVYCGCLPCKVCGFTKHWAIHGPLAGEPPGSKPWGHEYEPVSERAERIGG